MKRAILGLSILIATSFTPIAPPPLVTVAAAELPAPDVALCTNTVLFGPPQNGLHWGLPYILPVADNETEATYGELYVVGGATFVDVTLVTTFAAVIQRCPVVNRKDVPTGKFQDVVVIAEQTSTLEFTCEIAPSDVTAVQMAVDNWDRECLSGGSGDTRRPPWSL